MKRLFCLSIALMAALSIAVVWSGCVETTEPEEAVEEVTEEAYGVAREANIRAIDSAIMQYYEEYGTYPTSINQLVPAYLDSVPTDAAGGTYCIIMENGVAKAAVR